MTQHDQPRSGGETGYACAKPGTWREALCWLGRDAPRRCGILDGRIAAPAIGSSPVPHGVLAVDPPGCGCTECLTGEYVPLERATDAQVADLLAGTVQNNSGLTFTITVRVIPLFAEDSTPVAGNAPDKPAWHMIEDGWHLDTQQLMQTRGSWT